jgi:tetratricopeptide (TPR) repeat protein
MFWVDRAQMMTARGDRRRAIEYSRKAVSMSSTAGAILAAHLAYLGELQQAEEIARHLAPDSPKGRTFRALVRWKTGDLPGAIEELREIARGAPFSFDPPVPAPLYLLGEALAEAGRDAEAVESLRRFLAMPSTTPSWLEPKARFLLARCLERLGKREEARSELEALMVLWREASVDQPLLEDARQMVERLTIAK